MKYKYCVSVLSLALAMAVGLSACRRAKQSEARDSAGQSVQTQAKESTPQEEIASEQAEAFVRAFYIERYAEKPYIEDCPAPNTTIGDALQRRLERSPDEEGWIDYDPFIQGQDFDSATLLPSLRLEALGSGRVRVLLQPIPDTTPIEIILQLAYDADGSLRIISIPSDPNLAKL